MSFHARKLNYISILKNDIIFYCINLSVLLLLNIEFVSTFYYYKQYCNGHPGSIISLLCVFNCLVKDVDIGMASVLCCQITISRDRAILYFHQQYKSVSFALHPNQHELYWSF